MGKMFYTDLSDTYSLIFNAVFDIQPGLCEESIWSWMSLRALIWSLEEMWLSKEKHDVTCCLVSPCRNSCRRWWLQTSSSWRKTPMPEASPEPGRGPASTPVSEDWQLQWDEVGAVVIPVTCTFFNLKWHFFCGWNLNVWRNHRILYFTGKYDQGLINGQKYGWVFGTRKRLTCCLHSFNSFSDGVMKGVCLCFKCCAQGLTPLSPVLPCSPLFFFFVSTLHSYSTGSAFHSRPEVPLSNASCVQAGSGSQKQFAVKRLDPDLPWAN